MADWTHSCCIHTFGKVGQHLLILWRLTSPSWLYNIIVCMFCRTPKLIPSKLFWMYIYIPAWQLPHFIRSWWLRDKTWEWPGNKTSIIYKNLLAVLCRSSAYCPTLTVLRSSRVNAHHAYSRSAELTYVYSYDAVTHFKRHDIQQQVSLTPVCNLVRSVPCL